MSYSNVIELRVKNASGFENGSVTEKSPVCSGYSIELTPPQIEKLKQLEGECRVMEY